MSQKISYEAFNKSLAENEYKEFINSKGFSICRRFQLVKFRVRAKAGKYGDYKYLSYKNSWKVFWSNLSFKERNEIRNMPHLDRAVFEEITGINIGKNKEDYRL